MKIQTTQPFDEDFRTLPEAIKRRAEKQFMFLLANPRHPSLHTKKIKGAAAIWEGRVTRDYRFTFQVVGDTCILRRIGKHDETLRKP